MDTGSNYCRLSIPQQLEIAVRGESSSEPLAREPVSAADLSEAVSETWREQCLRSGYPEQALAELPVKLVPLYPPKPSQQRCRGFGLELTLPDGRMRRQDFGLRCLHHVAKRAAESLRRAGQLGAEEYYYYELTMATSIPPAALAPSTARPFSLHVKTPAPACLRVSLRPLLEACKAVDIVDDGDFPVFIEAAALAKAEACSRQGAQSVPPLESGGVLVGSLAYCEVTKEFFEIVTDVLEVNEAEQTTFRLAYSGRSWTRIQAILKARQEAYPTQALRLLGQCHGHNFLPNDGNRCEECDKRAVCSLTSVFVSADDQNWMRAVFARQPWALCQIFGLNARKEPVHQLYALKDGQWQPRGYFLLPEFK
jgi:hypothetical protein